jgi:hypothetical protein
MKKAIISTSKYAVLLILANIIGYYFFPDKFTLLNIFSCNGGAILGTFIVNYRYEKKKEKSNELHF